MQHRTTYLTVGDGTRIFYRDRPSPSTSPRPGPPVLLLHGLAGHLGEWDDLAGRLEASGHRVVSYDARGHGESTRRPASVSRAAHVEDAVTLLRELDLAPAIIVGQSLGGLTAMLLAADHPGLVHSLVLVEAGPAGRSPELPGEIAGWLDSWPLPFASLAEATAFLGHEAWARGLEERADGLRPRFDRDTLVRTMTELSAEGYWPQWSRIRCPTLLVRGASGTMKPAEAAEMLARRPDTRTAVVPGAAHDVHLDRPEPLHREIEKFLAERADEPNEPTSRRAGESLSR
ncbi:alpha/beta fold hydrolase [Streptomyces sp. NPDC050759]|uniref:alpha/beta fold hydrolase n=1 Tax=Streptomyces sp. NPDC050759 TaxID=3365635 RepID=UPI0037BC815D